MPVPSCPTLCSPSNCKPTKLLRPWTFPGKNTGVSCHFLPQGIFLTQGSNPQLLHHLHSGILFTAEPPGMFLLIYNDHLRWTGNRVVSHMLDIRQEVNIKSQISEITETQVIQESSLLFWKRTQKPTQRNKQPLPVWPTSPLPHINITITATKNRAPL